MKERGNFLLACFAVVILGLSASLYADTFEARVVGVSDGDTLTLLTANKTQVKARLIEIDAPEKKAERWSGVEKVFVRVMF